MVGSRRAFSRQLTLAFLLAAALATPARGANFSAVDQAARDAVASGEIPGAVVLLGRGTDILHHRAYGLRRVTPSQLPMTPDTIFDIASLTKPLGTTIAVMSLVERGALKLDAPELLEHLHLGQRRDERRDAAGLVRPLRLEDVQDVRAAPVRLPRHDAPPVEAMPGRREVVRMPIEDVIGHGRAEAVALDAAHDVRHHLLEVRVAEPVGVDEEQRRAERTPDAMIVETTCLPVRRPLAGVVEVIGRQGVRGATCGS